MTGFTILISILEDSKNLGRKFLNAEQNLKDSLGENVLILSDDLAQDSLIEKFSLEEVMTKPAEAGVDILIFSGYKVPVEQGLDEFLQAYKNGGISKETFQKAIDRIIQLKNKL